MLESVLEQHPKALLLLRLISYLPFALFAESLRVQSSVLSSICSSSSVTAPLTGCVKDLDRLWNLNLYELFGGFGSGRQWIVISIRNGNSFPLVNQGLLELAGLMDKLPQNFAGFSHARPVTVGVKFVLPSQSSKVIATSLGFWARHFVNSAHAVVHLCLAVVLGIFGIYTGSLLMSCLFAIDVLQATLRHGTSAVFAKPLASDGMPVPVYSDAPLDVHIIASSWNASHMDVFVGYSVQLYALTNISVRPIRPRFVLWALRLLDGILMVQAATLACSGSGNTDVSQCLGPVVWLVCYLLMLIPAYFLNSGHSGLFLQSQPGDTIKLAPVIFSKRSAALAFIAKLPVNQREQVGSSWMDGFVPNNKRREDWLRQLHASSLFSDSNKEQSVSEDMMQLSQEVNERFNDTVFKAALEQFQASVHAFKRQ